jgi:ABC-type lipopolysaccharide export system ATPase subunit
VLDFGKLLAYGSTKDVLELPEVRRAYLGESSEQLEKTLEACA